MVRRTRRLLDDGEVLLASAEGLEADGRRHRVVLVTDRRVLVGWARGREVDDYPRRDCVAEYATDGALLTLGVGEDRVTLRGVEAGVGRLVVDLVACRRDRSLSERLGAPFHVRVIRA